MIAKLARSNRHLRRHYDWHTELDIRAIKCTLGMDVLRCKYPEMVRKEIWTCLLAYNLIRKTMLQAAKDSDLSPRELSFSATIQALAASWIVISTLDSSTAAVMITVQLDGLTHSVVGNRPDRVEPRAVKRRPKPIRYLTMTRDKARALLLSGVDPYKRRK